MSESGRVGEFENLRVFADLTFTVDLGRGPIEGRVEGDGTSLRVTTDEPDTVWEAASSVPEIGTAALPFLADRLRDVGIELEVVGPNGRVAAVGAGASSRIGRLITGSSAVSPGDSRAVFGLVLARARRSRVRVLIGAAALAAAVVVLVGVRRAAR